MVDASRAHDLEGPLPLTRSAPRSGTLRSWFDSRMLRYLVKRLAFLVPQLLGISFITFYLIRLLPGDPATAILGSMATPGQIQNLREQLGLTQPVPVQYWLWLQRVLHGDLGHSNFTGNAVASDLLTRLPATLELITISTVLAMVTMIPLGLLLGRPGGRWRRKIGGSGAFVYGLLAGALPEFWIGLILIFVFYSWLGLAPAPLGRLDMSVVPPPRVTGFLTIDSVVAGDWVALGSALQHLILPVLSLAFVIGAPVLRMTRSMVENVHNSEYMEYARALGLRDRQVTRYALRNSLPPVLTMIGLIYSFQLGGAVLVEQVFSWGGAGQYAVQAIANADFWPVQGFVLIAGVFSVLIYLTVDLLYFAIDPRIEP